MKKRSDWGLLKELNKKGDVWVSAVLYFGLGIVVLTLILSVGMPVVNRLRDKNIATQTKDVFSSLDSNIREVARGGPGTQRILQLQMQKGEMKVYDQRVHENVDNIKANAAAKEVMKLKIAEGTVLSSVPNRIVWTYDGKAALSEPGLLVIEGNTKILTLGGSGAYTVRYWLDYEPSIYLRMKGVNTLTGGSQITIKNLGAQCPDPDTQCQDAQKRVAIEISA